MENKLSVAARRTELLLTKFALKAKWSALRPRDGRTEAYIGQFQGLRLVQRGARKPATTTREGIRTADAIGTEQNNDCCAFAILNAISIRMPAVAYSSRWL